MNLGKSVVLLLGLLFFTHFTFAAHAANPLAIPVPSPSEAICHGRHVASFKEALSTVVCIVAGDLNLPVYGGHLVLHPNRQSFESSLIAGTRFDPAYARQTASWALAVSTADRILVNEAALSALPWSQRIAVIAHEITHSTQYGLASGRRSTSEQWLREGFAEWVSARVTDFLEPGSLAQRTRLAVSRIRKTSRQGLPSLSQLVTFREFAELRTGFAGSAVYDVSFLAADFLIGKVGLPAVVNYFRLFSLSDDRGRNFQTAFGQDLSALEDRFSSYLQKLVE
ncbi:MAG: Peptidase superfamily [Deltaproteobacteria bacterium]|nr:Peptidase superfamily [Deltaproteobacteria bacterium]